MSLMETNTVTRLYSCEGARVLEDFDGVAFIEIDENEPEMQDWYDLHDWVAENGYWFGSEGPVREYGEAFQDSFGDRFYLMKRGG